MVRGEFVPGGVEPKPLPKPDPEPEPNPEFEPPTGVEVLLAGCPMVPVLPAWVRVSVSGS